MQRRDPYSLNFADLKMQKWNIADFAQRAFKKNEVIFLVIMFTPRVTVIKMSKNGLFLVFSADDSKKLVTVGTKYLSAPERSYWVGMVSKL